MNKNFANINVACKAPKEIKWVLGDIGKPHSNLYTRGRQNL
jgi:hypothetical protein